ncbi:hypothetical protein U5640_01485 [Streptomyces sp. SS7]|uniref:hypothetical protein n=1 Tax=Streptomyces sp. SS7 TaxID=3108485 RepID=UPI0030EC990A
MAAEHHQSGRRQSLAGWARTPTSVAVHGSEEYVTDAAYTTNTNPNFMTAHLAH